MKASFEYIREVKVIIVMVAFLFWGKREGEVS